MIPKESFIMRNPMVLGHLGKILLRSHQSKSGVNDERGGLGRVSE